jgi:hypothetical protein
VLGQPVSYQAGALSLPSAGYSGFHAPERGDRFVIDCGELGPDYQPGHAHCDLLSYELDLDGIPLVVDSGVSGYDGDPLREYMRSTRAHNTVSVEGRDQHEMWGTFRVARRARPGPVAQGLDEKSSYRFQGSYSPYWSPSVRHERTATRGAAGIWRIVDRITGTPTVRLESFVHLNPTSTVLVRELVAEVRIGTRAWLVEFFGVDRLIVVRGNDSAGQSWYSPRFGGAVPSPCVVAQVQSYSGGEFGYSIKPLTRGEP